MEYFKTYQQKAFLVVEFTMEIMFGAEVLKGVQGQLKAVLEEKQARKVVLDLENVREISSQFLGAMVALHTSLSKRSGKLVVCGLNAKLSELMSLTRLDRVITVVPTVRDAVERDVFLG